MIASPDKDSRNQSGATSGDFFKAKEMLVIDSDLSAIKEKPTRHSKKE